MSIPPDSPWRGCASSLRQPVNENDVRAAQFLEETVYYFNCREQLEHRLPDIVYRSSESEYDDILHRVFRWDTVSYREAFTDGFEARRQQGTPDETFFNIYDYVHNAGRPLDSRRPVSHAFVSTTLSNSWYPTTPFDPRNPQRSVQVYRYEIYAPGGIWVEATLGDRYDRRLRRQDEVTFVAGIAPQYIRSAQLFTLTANSHRSTTLQRVNNRLVINNNFDPQSHPPRLLEIDTAVCDYEDRNGNTRYLELDFYPPADAHDDHVNAMRRKKREASSSSSHNHSNHPTNWYTHDVLNCKSYIDAAFRCSTKNEAHLFMKNQYVLLNYAPGTTNDEVQKGPLLISDAFPFLRDTAFGEYGIDCAFKSHVSNQAFIFSGNLCAKINNHEIIQGPITITRMFPYLFKTPFERGLDAAFEATTSYQAYLFKGKRYALINYGPDNPGVIETHLITEGFPCLRGTTFETGIQAAFAAHATDEAYIFKKDSYALIKFTRGKTKIIGGEKKIKPNWPSLRPLLPRQNRGFDLPVHTGTGTSSTNTEF